MDIFDWLLNNGSVLNGEVVARILFIAIIIEFIGIVGSTFGRLGR